MTPQVKEGAAMKSARAETATTPGRTDFLPFHRPHIDEDDIRAVGDALRSGWLTHGAVCRRFEKEFAAAVEAKHAVAVSSCTAAMQLSLQALGIGPGDEVITTPFTFCATAHVIEHVGATPVFVDVEPDMLQIDPAGVQRAVTSRTRAILPVHFGGHPYDIEATNAGLDGMPTIEDAAHAFGAAIGRVPIGGFGTITCFSFYATKAITTGEGGMATTNDDALAERLEILRLHGISRDAWNRYGRGGSWAYDVSEAGLKANLTDFQAALGLTQLAKEPWLRDRRTRIAACYDTAFSRLNEFVEIPHVAAGVRPAWHLYPLRLRLEALSVDRDRFIEELEAANIGASVHFIPLHLLEHFRQRFGLRLGDFPVAESAFKRIISLPLYPSMSDGDVGDVVSAVQGIIHRHSR
jgi:dTDP-4-amino-4,6-dideoxygalactose transaminase